MKLPLLLGLLVVTLGALALFGWAMDIPVLESIFPGFATMKANTALGLMLGGLELALLSRKKIDIPLRLCTATLAVAIATLGALTLGEYFFGWNFRIDEFLFRDAIHTVGTSFPGRMSPSTAFCFVLVGSALWAASQQVLRQLRVPVLSGLSAALIVICGAACARRVP